MDLNSYPSGEGCANVNVMQQQLVGVANLLFTTGQAGIRAPERSNVTTLAKTNHGAAKLAMANATKTSC